jgi:hypothetical protein
VSVPGQALASHRSGKDIERRKESRCALPFVVVSQGAGAPRLHR